jgi:hypothetical protein
MSEFGRMTDDEKMAARRVVEDRASKLSGRPDSRTPDGLIELVRALRERKAAR